MPDCHPSYCASQSGWWCRGKNCHSGCNENPISDPLLKGKAVTKDRVRVCVRVRVCACVCVCVRMRACGAVSLSGSLLTSCHLSLDLP